MHGQFAIGHNGNLVNAGELRAALVREGAIFQTNSDTEVLVHLFARSREKGTEAADRRRYLAGARRFLVRDDDQGSRHPACATPTASGRLPLVSSARRG